MTRGFWKGLFHGAVISVAGLAALSLVTPLPEEAAEGEITAPELIKPESNGALMPEKPVQDRLDSGGNGDQARTLNGDISQPAVNVPIPAEPDVITNDSVGDVGGPQAADVSLPVGSEFGRGGDVAPQLPAPMVSELQSRQTDAPAVSAPTAEPAPVAITDPGLRPATDLPELSLNRSEIPENEQAPMPDMPIPQVSPSAPQTPEVIGAGVPDNLPSAISERFEADTTVVEIVTEPDQSAESSLPAAPAENVTNIPTLPSPELDLSTPPDLSDLRGLQE